MLMGHQKNKKQKTLKTGFIIQFDCHLLVTSLSYLNHKKYVFIIFLMAPGAFVTVYPLIFNVLKKVVIISYYY